MCVDSKRPTASAPTLMGARYIMILSYFNINDADLIYIKMWR
jgi:hypothetical protein